jgi:hypothetical protein
MVTDTVDRAARAVGAVAHSDPAAHAGMASARERAHLRAIRVPQHAQVAVSEAVGGGATVEPEACQTAPMIRDQRWWASEEGGQGW